MTPRLPLLPEPQTRSLVRRGVSPCCFPGRASGSPPCPHQKQLSALSHASSLRTPPPLAHTLTRTAWLPHQPPPCSWAAGHQMPKGHPVREVLSRPLPSQTPPSSEPPLRLQPDEGQEESPGFPARGSSVLAIPSFCLISRRQAPRPPGLRCRPSSCPPPLPSLPSDGVPSPSLLRPSPRDSSLGMLHPARIPERDGAGNTALRCALRGHSFQTSKPSAMATVRTYFICNSFEYKTGNDTDCFTF